MKRIRNGIEGYKQKQLERKERQRQERVDRHPHTATCTKSLDIELFDQVYEAAIIPGGLFNLGILTKDLVDYKTRCQECLTESCKKDIERPR